MAAVIGSCFVVQQGSTVVELRLKAPWQAYNVLSQAQEAEVTLKLTEVAFFAEERVATRTPRYNTV